MGVGECALKTIERCALILHVLRSKGCRPTGFDVCLLELAPAGLASIRADGTTSEAIRLLVRERVEGKGSCYRCISADKQLWVTRSRGVGEVGGIRS